MSFAACGQSDRQYGGEQNATNREKTHELGLCPDRKSDDQATVEGQLKIFDKILSPRLS
jgi:hypothetical protein